MLALTFEYRGIAESEVRAARRIARSAGVEGQRFFRLPDLKEARDLPGHRLAGMLPTYIPMRNAIFYSVGASCAEEVGADFIIGGHIKEDFGAFPDTRPEFFAGLERSFWTGSRALGARKTRILRPLGGKTKVEVIRLAASLGVPLELTWSCHRGGRKHCWECRGCLARRESFERAGVPDPLYEPSIAGKIS